MRMGGGRLYKENETKHKSVKKKVKEKKKCQIYTMNIK